MQEIKSGALQPLDLVTAKHKPQNREQESTGLVAKDLRLWINRIPVRPYVPTMPYINTKDFKVLRGVTCKK